MRLNKLYFLLLLSAFALTNCAKEDVPNACGYVPVRYETGICGYAILKIEHPSFYELGEDVDDYEHVFLAQLECFTDQQALEDKSFLVELNPPTFNDDCARCLAMVAYSGSKNYRVRIHEKCDTVE
jgi:hypothetical protein